MHAWVPLLQGQLRRDGERSCKSRAAAAVAPPCAAVAPAFAGDDGQVLHNRLRGGTRAPRVDWSCAARHGPTAGTQLALIAECSYHAFITDRDGDPVTLDAWHRAHATCENAIPAPPKHH